MTVIRRQECFLSRELQNNSPLASTYTSAGKVTSYCYHSVVSSPTVVGAAVIACGTHIVLISASLLVILTDGFPEYLQVTLQLYLERP
jgi:hypothetical protein